MGLFCRSPERVRNPHLRAKLAETLEALVPIQKSQNSAGLLSVSPVNMVMIDYWHCMPTLVYLPVNHLRVFKFIFAVFLQNWWNITMISYFLWFRECMYTALNCHFVLVFSQKQVAHQWKKYRELFLYEIEDHVQNLCTFEGKDFHTNFPLIIVFDHLTHAGDWNQHWADWLHFSQNTLTLNSTSLSPICFSRKQANWSKAILVQQHSNRCLFHSSTGRKHSYNTRLPQPTFHGLSYSCL